MFVSLRALLHHGPSSDGSDRGRRRRRQSAQSLTEFAMILPLLTLILLGVVDFGRVFYYWTSIANAAREGARYGSTHPTQVTTACKPDPNNLKYRVKQEAGTTMTITDTNIKVYWVDATTGVTTDAANCSPLPADRRIYQNPNSVRVDVYYDFNAITPLISNFWGGGNLRIASSAAMVIE
jgi:Flp pilus assembly protein TadG